MALSAVSIPLYVSGIPRDPIIAIFIAGELQY
jgi:hypothetical protein